MNVIINVGCSPDVPWLGPSRRNCALKGPGCEEELCPRDKQGNLCSNNGKSYFDNGKCKCKCKPEYSGKLCDITKCPKDKDGNLCSAPRGNATVKDNGTCVCKCLNGFSGTYFEFQIL